MSLQRSLTLLNAFHGVRLLFENGKWSSTGDDKHADLKRKQMLFLCKLLKNVKIPEITTHSYYEFKQIHFLILLIDFIPSEHKTFFFWFWNEQIWIKTGKRYRSNTFWK